MRYLITLLLFFLSLTVYSQKGKKIEFIGGARSLVSHSNFISDGDTSTTPKSTGGYALLDLGIKINPNSKTEILGMFRINNKFGGFWGGGVSFDVRQLYIRGVAADIIRYHVGNIDYKLTPYTFFNHNSDILTSSIGTMAIKEDVVNYESFYNNNNTWRQQGAAINFSLIFPKIIDEMDFNGFITRLNPSNFNNIMDRLYGGGNVVIKKTKNASLGLNHASVFDLKNTSLDSNVFKNNVSSITYDINYKKNNTKIGLDGESGIGLVSQSLFPNNGLSDYFINTRAYINCNKEKFNLSFELGFMDNGPDFRSFGAQSKRIDFNKQNNFYNRYTNDQILRQISAYDIYNDPNLFNQGITVGVMNYNPSINNVLPYGIASFNRRGIYFGSSYSDEKKIISAETKYFFLKEIRGQGTTNLKTFNMISFNGKFNAHNYFKKMKNDLTIQLGASYQDTKRNGEYTFENVDLNSFQLNFGVEKELLKKLYLMGNIFMLSSVGNEQIPVRDSDGQIINYNDYTVNGEELNFSGGLRFDFSKDVYLAALFEWNKNRFIPESPYTYNQLSIFYIMKF